MRHGLRPKTMNAPITLNTDQIELLRELLGTEVKYEDSVQFVAEASQYIGRVKYLLRQIDAQLPKTIS